MVKEYSVDVCRALGEKFRLAGLHRPMRIDRYDAGDELVYEITGVLPSNKGKVRLEVEKFVGGGFAGQVYRVRIIEIDGSIISLEAGRSYAMKILVPPSAFSLLFRNIIYRIGFQGPFQPQVNPSACRAGAIWQKFIRRAAQKHFDDARSVVDIYATFVDSTLGSCGELSEWVDGRNWRFEVNDRMDLLKRWWKGEKIDETSAGSCEYRAKRKFMSEFVELLHRMGAYEFARQYEWYTCKSQPNCLKRVDTEVNPISGLTAVDFRAGLALLPFLPMSPADVVLIFKGIMRGSVVQFDRGDLQKLERFVEADSENFGDMRESLRQLQEAESVYRNSVPDITHNGVKVFYSWKLWSTILDSAVTGWEVQKTVDKEFSSKLRASRLKTMVFYLLGVIPILGNFLRHLWGNSDYRRHYAGIITSWGYFRRAVSGNVTEKIIIWHRGGRVNQQRALSAAGNYLLFAIHFLLSWLPVGIHRFLTDARFAKDILFFIFVWPVLLYFKADVREQWLREMVSEGRKRRMLSDEDSESILSSLQEPFIQKYLKSLAVHICTLPVTQMVSVTVAWLYVRMHPGLSAGESAAAIAGILLLFQVTPVSPGSITRGFYVLYVVIREWNFRDYNIAVFLGFFKYVGYLAFPIQMAYRYPSLARFMAVHWATGVVHIVPVFGESGALLEHKMFDWFYNWPLTLRRRMNLWADIRSSLRPRIWHIVPIVLAGAAIFIAADIIYLHYEGVPAALGKLWFLSVTVPFLTGRLVTLYAGGLKLSRRIMLSAAAGFAAGIIPAMMHLLPVYSQGLGVGRVVMEFMWRGFVFTIFSIVGAILTELKLSEPSSGGHL